MQEDRDNAFLVILEKKCFILAVFLRALLKDLFQICDTLITGIFA